MTSRFKRIFKRVAIVHAVVLVGVLLASGWRGCVRKPTVHQIPIEFMVAAPSEPSTTASDDPAPVVPDPTPDPTPVVTKPRRKPIQVNSKRVTRTKDPKPTPALTAEEIQKRLRLGATLCETTTAIPEEDARCDLIVNQTFYRAWVPPSADVVGRVTAKVSIKLGANGVVLGRSLLRSSGHDVMDASVMQAANAVKRISGLTPGYIKRTDTVIVPFEVE